MFGHLLLSKRITIIVTVVSVSCHFIDPNQIGSCHVPILVDKKQLHVYKTSILFVFLGVNQSCLTLDGVQFGKYASFVQIEGEQQNDMNTYGLQLGKL